MRCEELEAIVFSEREATAQEREAMRRHAGACGACRALLDNEAALGGARALDERVDVPESFAAGWRACIRRAQRPAQARREAPRAWSRAAGTLSGAWRGWIPRAAAYACCAALLLGVGAQLGRRTQGENMPQAAQYGAMSGYAAYDGGASDGAKALGRAATDAAQADGKIVHTARLSLNVSDVDAAIDALRTRVQALDGSVASCEVSGARDEARAAHLALSVPSTALDELLAGVQEIGEVTQRSSSAVDMADSYRDNASRLESARAKKQRLDELYAKAQDVEDIIAVTGALFDVQAEIDSLEGANRDIDARSDLAQVYVALTQSVAAARAATPLPARLLDRLAQGAQALADGAGNLAMLLAYALPTLAALAAAALAARGIYRRCKKHD